MTRTDSAILARITEVTPTDWMGTQRSDLLAALPYAAAKPMLKPEATEADWPKPMTHDEIHGEAVSYIDFAVGKALDHRGLSAGRSIDHYRAWLWLLGHDNPFDGVDYAPYGMPQLGRVVELLGVVLPQASDPTAARMLAGERCEPDCTECFG